MNNFGKLVVKMGLLSLLSVMPLAAQIDNSVDFKAPFPFYAGDTKLPAGRYRITHPDANGDVLLVESVNGAPSAFVDFVPTQSAQPHRKSDVTFQKYGDTDYLNRVWIQGQNYGMKVEPSKVEAQAAADANAVQHSKVASGQ
ncbi:MAG TPA: hypothetical protein VGM27_04045 [Acidobacteriaceae bacterium]|jgi:hypothetical protein